MIHIEAITVHHFTERTMPLNLKHDYTQSTILINCKQNKEKNVSHEFLQIWKFF